MSASAIAMSTKMAALDDLKEGEYETQFGRVTISRTGDGYKIVIYINEKELGRSIAKQIALSMVGPYLRKGEPAV
jgi:hypothetical protein